MKVTILLCDFVEAAEGKLFIVGGGWSIKGPGAPIGLAIKVEVPWSEANRTHSWSLRLLSADGAVVEVETPLGPRPLQLGGTFEVGRPPGIPEGTPLDVPLAINLTGQGIPLAAGERYEWKFTINDQPDPNWHVGFLVAGDPN